MNDKEFISQLQEKWQYLSDKQKDLILRLIDALLDDEKQVNTHSD